MEHTDSIERDSEYVERRRRCALVRELPQPDRVLLEWRVVDGWDYAEIALHLGIPRADLVKRVQRIRTDLRRKEKALGAGETKLNRAALLTV
jgi:DNA-directed RNA polymerase specialized sigma24 family protein